MILLAAALWLVQSPPASSFPVPEAARERPWLALLHYKRGESQADGPGFFLSPRGKKDPAAELQADLDAFASTAPVDRDQTAQCRFPARYFWAKRRFGLTMPDQRCPRFEEWRDTLDAGSVTLVFADAFLANPSSMYGHTFLRLRRRRGDQPLLDYTINFAGNPDTDNALFYAFKGIFGLFPGTYSTMPYYMKIQEYSHIESRDLWEYDLALSSETVDQLVRHAWELGSTWFDYYFFSENCSYQLLALIDGAEPDLRLSDSFGFGTIPADTVRAVLRRPGLVAARRYRPSHVNEMLALRSKVPEADLPLVDRVGRLDTTALPELAALSKRDQAAVLDAGYDYLRYRDGFSDKPAAEERSLLVARGKLGEPPTEAQPAPPHPLEDGHETFRVGLGAGVSTWGLFQEVSIRPALHDLAADVRGYSEGSQLEMGAVQARFDDRQNLPYLERLALVDIVSLTPWDRWVKKPSWHVFAGADQAKELNRAPVDSLVGEVKPGGGLSFAPDLPLRPLLYGFADAEVQQSRNIPQKWRVGGGPSGGLLLRPFPAWRLLLEAAYVQFVQNTPHHEELKATTSWSLWRNGELRLTLDRRPPDSEAGGSLLIYF